MNTYIAVSYRTEDQRQSILKRIEQLISQEAPFHIGRLHIYDYPTLHLIVASAEAYTSAFEHQEHVAVDEGGGLIFDGAPFFEGFERDAHWARQIRRVATSAQATFEALLGDYSLIRFGPEGLFALGDFAGLRTVFYMEHDGMVVVSNRQRLIHRVMLGHVDIDPAAASWLTGQANIIGENSVYRGVKIVTPGRVLIVSDGKASMTGFQRFYQHDERLDDLPNEIIAEATTALQRQAEAMGSLPLKPMQMDLTGGMDSRAVLALVSSTSLGKLVECARTFDATRSAEVIVAEQVAAAVGMPHQALINPPPPPESAGTLWNRLRLNVAIVDGTVAANASPSGIPKVYTPSLSGSGGELYRPHVKPRRHETLATLDEAFARFEHYQQQTDPLHIQRTETTAAQKAEMRASVRRMQSWFGVPYDDMHYVVYAESRMPWWAGYSGGNIMGRRKLYPLVNYKVARDLFRGPADQRKIDRMHFEIMRQCKPELVNLPFLENAWDERLKRYAPDLRIPAPVPATAGVSSPHWCVQLASAEWTKMFDYILAKPNSVVFDFLDRNKVTYRAKDREKFHRMQAQCMSLSAVVQLRMLEDGDYTHVKQGEPAPTPERIEKTFPSSKLAA